jgi:O-antigen/teichoic acid export membrane protein
MTDTATLDRKILSSSLWVALSWGGKNLLSVLSTIVLARILAPSDFGVVALAIMFTLLLQHVQSTGIASAIIYRREDAERAASTGLVFSSIVGVLLFVLTLVVAPILADLFRMPQATNVIRGMGFLFVINGLSAGPGALLERELNFRSRAKGELAAGIVQISVAVGLAVAGAGAWSLVGGQLAAAAVQCCVFWVLVPWRPSFSHVSWSLLREMLRYGRFVSAGQIIVLANETMDNMFVARLLGSAALGFYAITFRLADFPTAVIGYIVGRVMFPAYARLQDDLDAFRRAFVQNLQRVTLFALPLTIGLIVAAHPIVLAMLGERWLPVVGPLRILALYSLVKSFAAPCGAVYQAAGKPHLVPIWALPNAILIVPLLLVLIPRMGVTGAAVAMAVAFAASGVPAVVVAMRMLRLGPLELGRALAMPALCSGLLAVVLLLLVRPASTLNPILALVVMVAAGLAAYAASAAVLARSTWLPMWAALRRKQPSRTVYDSPVQTAIAGD